VLIFLTVGIGGGSLVLFGYFLLFGSPFTIGIAHSHASRLAFDSLLCLVFFVQHSGMVRRGAKERLAKHIPGTYHAALYSIASGAALIIMVILWQPTDQFVFRLGGLGNLLSFCLALLAVAGFAWGVQALGGFDPFGTLPLKAVSRGIPSPSLPFVARGPYRYVRHPLYLFMLLLIWSTPRLSTDRLLFNALWTAWVVVGTRLEERDLLADFGEHYQQYQRSVPMLVPSLRLRSGYGRSTPAA
jgi:protein-S-isoprenylcysteine O-methyltransferase Ste14